MDIANDQEPICWANRVTRERDAFGWDDNGNRIRLFDDKTGAPRVERIPQQPHLGTPLFGLRNLNVQRAVKVLCDDGNERQIVITNAAAHINDTDDSYKRYQLGTKGARLGWIPDGQCPAAMVMMGLISPSTVKADAAKDGQPCGANVVGWGRPPCRHYKAERAKRLELRRADDARRADALKTEEAKLLEQNAANQKETAAAMTSLSAQMVAAVSALSARLPDAPAKGAGK